MPDALRIALLVDPLTVLVKGARHALELERELEARGHTVRIFGAPPGLTGRTAVADSAAPGAVGTEKDSDDSDARFAIGGRSILGFSPNMLVAYDALSPGAWVASRLARKHAIPLLLLEPGRLGGGSAVRRSLWAIGERLWGSYVRRTAYGLVALDPVARDQAIEEGFDPNRIEVLPHGVDLDVWRPGLSSERIFRHRITGRILLHTGSLEPRSGCEGLIQAFASTVGQRGDWSLVIAGSRHIPPRLVAAAHRLGVSARVHFLRVRDSELPALVSSSTLFAQPALDDRTGALSVQRAMACGVPVLASDLPRMRFFVEQGDAGLTAEPGNVQAWIEMIQRVAVTPVGRERWGHNGRKFAEQRFAWPKVAAAWEATMLAKGEPVRKDDEAGVPVRA